MGDSLETPGAAGTGSDLDSDERQVYGFKSEPPTGGCIAQVAVSGKASSSRATNTIGCTKVIFKCYCISTSA